MIANLRLRKGPAASTAAPSLDSTAPTATTAQGAEVKTGSAIGKKGTVVPEAVLQQLPQRKPDAAVGAWLDLTPAGILYLCTVSTISAARCLCSTSYIFYK